MHTYAQPNCKSLHKILHLQKFTFMHVNMSLQLIPSGESFWTFVALVWAFALKKEGINSLDKQ